MPFGTERYVERGGQPVLVKRQVVLTGDEPHRRAARLRRPEPASRRSTSTSTRTGARILRDVTRENIGKRMAILLFEKGKGEVVTAPVIRGEIGGALPDHAAA